MRISTLYVKPTKYYITHNLNYLKSTFFHKYRILNYRYNIVYQIFYNVSRYSIQILEILVTFDSTAVLKIYTYKQAKII